MLDTRGASKIIVIAQWHHLRSARHINSPQELLDLVAAVTTKLLQSMKYNSLLTILLPVIRTLIAQGKRVIIAGLDLDYRAEAIRTNRLQSLQWPIPSPNFKQFARICGDRCLSFTAHYQRKTSPLQRSDYHDWRGRIVSSTLQAVLHY